jgi:hypothetical protein
MQEVIHLAAVSEKRLSGMLPIVRDYGKVASMLWIRALGEPTLDGIVITHWSMQASVALRIFCHSHQCRDVLLRIDKRGKRWSTRRGGYLIQVQDARNVLAELNNEDMIAVFLEPWSPYRDMYCLSSVIIPEENKGIVEVVGPGFDTSDLVRSDLLPHERFELRLSGVQPGVAVSTPCERNRTYLVAPEEYRKAVEERLRKIGARLKNAAYPKEVLECATEDSEKLRQQAAQYLKRTRQTLLLRHADKYVPIPERYLSRFVAGVFRVLAGLQRYHIDLGTVTFSGAFTPRGRFVFWDFFPADTKRAASLYTADVDLSG